MTDVIIRPGVTNVVVSPTQPQVAVDPTVVSNRVSMTGPSVSIRCGFVLARQPH